MVLTGRIFQLLFMCPVGREMYKCEVPGCAYAHDRTSCLRSHWQHNHPELPALSHKCRKCPYPFSTAELALQHERTCPHPHPLICDLCGMVFRHKAQKSTHVRAVHGMTAAEIKAARQQPPPLPGAASTSSAPAELPVPEIEEVTLSEPELEEAALPEAADEQDELPGLVPEQDATPETAADDAVSSADVVSVRSAEESVDPRPSTSSDQSDVASTSSSASSFLKALYGDDGNLITEMRLSDGYINATKMCRSAGKEWHDFYRLPSTARFLKELADSIFASEETQSPGKSRSITHPLVITSMGRNGGTWVHPDVGIELAGWCSVKFKVQVIGLVRRYMRGEVTTEESTQVAQAINNALQPVAQLEAQQSVPAIELQPETQVVAATRPRKFGDWDIFQPPSDKRHKVLPTLALAPNGVYILILGVTADGTMEIGMWGLGSDLYKRLNDHFKAYKYSKITAIITCGTHTPKNIENSVKVHLAPWHFPIQRDDGSMNTECFAVPVEDAHQIYAEVLDMVGRGHEDQIDSITLYGQTIRSKAPPAGQLVPVAHDLLAVEKERSFQAQQSTKQEELKVRALELQLELARFQASQRVQ